MVLYGKELPGISTLKLQETGCLIFNRKDLNFGATLTPIDLVGILINGFPSGDNNNKKEVKTNTVQMQPSGVAFSTAKV